MAAGEHWHSEQYHVERYVDLTTGRIMITSYCLFCGEAVHNIALKENIKRNEEL